MFPAPSSAVILRRRPKVALEGWPRTSPSPFEARCKRCSHLRVTALSPHLFRQLNDHAQLGPLLVLAQQVAFLGGSKAALRREAELLERDVFGSLVDAPFEVVRVLQRAELGRDKAEHNLFVALGHEAQRLEAAGPLGVVFKKEAVVVDSEQRFGDRFIAAL